MYYCLTRTQCSGWSPASLRIGTDIFTTRPEIAFTVSLAIVIQAVSNFSTYRIAIHTRVFILVSELSKNYPSLYASMCLTILVKLLTSVRTDSTVIHHHLNQFFTKLCRCFSYDSISGISVCHFNDFRHKPFFVVGVKLGCNSSSN